MQPGCRQPEERYLSTQAMMAVLDRASKDQRFNWRMMTDPDTALAEFDLTSREKAALKSCERSQLVDCGLDERLAIWVPWRVARRHVP